MNEKYTIEATRDNPDVCWTASINGNRHIACEDDVGRLFSVGRSLAIDFKFTTRKPRHDDHHKFVWKDSNYTAVSTSGTEEFYIPYTVGRLLRRRMRSPATIYVVVEA